MVHNVLVLYPKQPMILVEEDGIGILVCHLCYVL